MSNMAVIDKRTGRRITVDDITTSQPQKTLELLVKMGRAVWENEQIEVSPTDAISILNAERDRLIIERDELEEEKKEVRTKTEEILIERLRLEAVRNSFEIEKKNFELEVKKFKNKKSNQ